MRAVNKVGYNVISSCLLIALIVEVFFIYKSKDFLNKDAETTLRRIVTEQAIPIEETIKRAEDFASNVSNVIEGTINFDEIKNNQKKIDKYEEKIAPVFENLVKEYELKNIWYQANTRILGGVSLIGFRDIKGVMHREQKWDIIGSPYENADWWRGPKEKGKNWTDVYYYAPWNMFLTSFGKKVEHKGNFLGIVSVDMSVDEIKNILAKSVIYKTGFFVLMDSNWNYIYKPKTTIEQILDFDNAVIKELKKEMLKNNSSKGNIRLVIKGEEKTLSYQKLSNGWLLLAVVPLKEATEKTDIMLIFIIGCAVIIVVLVGVFATNIISVLKKQYKVIEDSYHYDNITALPNRISLINDLEKYRIEREGYLVVIHIENIIEIFNMVGHSKSDIVLKSISEYLSRINNAKKIKAYNSHSLKFEFLLLDYNFESLKFWIKDFINSINNFSICIEDKGIFLKTTMGVSRLEGNKNGEITITEAYKALEFACDNFMEYYIYDNKLEKTFFTTFLVSQVNEAIKNNEFYLEYQPKLDLSNNVINEVEALIRWKHPEYGIIPPDEFIPKLEKTDTIKALTNWVLNRAMSDIKEWDKKGIKLNVAVNITPRDLKDKKFISQLYELIEKHEIDYERINLEITETDLIREMDNVFETINQLKEKGIRISIDDFGTGYSSLSYINALPIDCIKIDRSFVKDLLTNKKKNKLLQDTMALLHNLEKTVVAEGVEDLETLNYLHEMGCEEIQGYYVSRPLCKLKLEEFLKNYI